MAQTTGAISFRANAVRVSTNSEGWNSMTDISGSSNNIVVTGGERNVGATHTYDGDTPIIRAGKRNELTVNIDCVYTETAGEAFLIMRDIYETAGGECYVMWAPQGSSSGARAYDTGKAICSSPTYPSGDAASGDPVMGTFGVTAAAISGSTL